MNSIYIHIPFCVRKCLYCDFFSVPFSEDMEEKYVTALCESIKNRKEYFKNTVKTIYFGGGTPTVLRLASFEKIFSCLYDFDIDRNAEITAEANPGTVSYEKLKDLRKFFNRISVGVQSFSDRELKVLGRIHTAEEGEKSLLLAEKAGFENISLDLMYALPGQKISDFEMSVRKSVSMPVSHISAYELTIEENTPFGRNREKLSEQIDENCDFDNVLTDILAENGFVRYEVSNYAKEGFESKHNLNYWNNGEYLGFGAGACGYIKGERYKIISDTAKFEESHGEALEYSEKLSGKSLAFENLMLGLRMKNGFPVSRVTKYLSEEEKKIFSERIEKEKRSLVLKDGYLSATEYGLRFLNTLILNLYSW